jgi:transposase
VSDHKGAAIIYPKLPTADMLIGDKGYDSDAFRDALTKRGITPCIPPRAKRRLPATYCKALYKQRHKIENMFARLKDWRRIALRPLRTHLLQRNLHRRNRHLLDQSRSPEPSTGPSLLREHDHLRSLEHAAWPTGRRHAASMCARGE